MENKSQPNKAKVLRAKILAKGGRAMVQQQRIKTEICKRVISHKRIRPEKVVRGKIPGSDAPRLLLDVPFISCSQSVESTTPDWFRSTAKADISVIIPMYKSSDVIGDLIQSWDVHNNGMKVEIIFVDDCCPLNSKDYVINYWSRRKADLRGPIGKIIYNPVNLGFGQSCNVGARFATGDSLIFLNSDTVVTPNWIRPIIRLLQQDNVGIVGNLQLKRGGLWEGCIDSAGSEWDWDAMSFLHIGREVYQSKRLPKPFRPENCPEDLSKIGECDMVTGCCFAISKSLFNDIGGFNANYRIAYWEDSELCMCVRERGLKVMYQPNSVIYHQSGHSKAGTHRYHSHNNNFFKNKWINSGRIDAIVKQRRHQRPELKTILLKRSGALGDVLLAAAVAPALKRKHPGCEILFATQCPEVLKNNPHIDRVLSDQAVSERLFQLYYNLDLAYEYRPYTPIMRAYAETVGVPPEDCHTFMTTEPVEVPERYVVVHPTKASKSAWVGRGWPKENFAEVAKLLMSKGEKVVIIGEKDEADIPCDIDLRGETTLAQLAYVIQHATCFVGIDSFPMHIAETFNVPAVVFFGSIDPKLRINKPTTIPLSASGISCLGCHHRQTPPCTVTSLCETRTQTCLSGVSVHSMWETISRILYKSEDAHGRKI